MKKKNYLLLLCLIICTGCATTGSITKKQSSLPVLDFNEKYPSISFKWSDIAETTYIPLETNKDVLVDRYREIVHVSDNRIVVCNNMIGDVFIFDDNGKNISSFNYRGPGPLEYNYISTIVYDEKTKEIFIHDRITKKILVFTESGTPKHNFNYSQQGYEFGQMFNYDDDTLLAHHDGMTLLTENDKQPYMFISKKDGTIVSRLNIKLSKILSLTLHENNTTDGSTMSGTTTMLGHSPIYQFGNEFVIAERSSDTVYLLTSGKKLTPLFVREPSVFIAGYRSLITIRFKDDDVVFFSVNTLDMKRATQDLKKDQPISEHITNYFYDLRNRQLFENNSKLDMPRLMDADIFLEYIETAKKMGTPAGNLLFNNNFQLVEKIAPQIHEEDNPILIRHKLKQNPPWANKN